MRGVGERVLTRHPPVRQDPKVVSLLGVFATGVLVGAAGVGVSAAGVAVGAITVGVLGTAVRVAVGVAGVAVIAAVAEAPDMAAATAPALRSAARI